MRRGETPLAPRPLDAAHARRAAVAAVLNPVDLPGYRAERYRFTRADRVVDLAYARCTGTRVASYLVREPGRVFTADGTRAHSSADVTRSAVEARREMAVIKGPRGRRCLQQLVAASYRRAGVRDVSVRVTAIPMTIPESDADFVYAIEGRGTKDGQEVGISAFLMGSLVGQTEVALSAFLGTHETTLTELNILMIAAVARVRGVTP